MTERKRHMCDVCGEWGEWGPEWQWYGSIKDMEDGKVLKVCSEKCKAEAEAELTKNGGVFRDDD